MGKPMFALGGLLAGYLAASPAWATPPHLDPEMTGAEYRVLNAAKVYLDAGDLQPILDMGQRSLAWIDIINAARAPSEQLQLSTPATTKGHPIDDPHYYNRDLIKQAFAIAVAQIPSPVLQILAGQGPLPPTPGLSDDEFLVHARAVDTLYQDASRWLAMEPYLEEMAAGSRGDVRPLFILDKEVGLEAKLRGWSKLDGAEQGRLGSLLVGLCHNSGESVERCQTALTEALPNNAFDVYSAWLPNARSLWQSYFELYALRPDVTWTQAEPNTMHVPFLTPDIAKVRPWLSDNIEDEWHQGTWQLRLDFHDQDQPRIPHVLFERGATPHVSGLDVITMDAARNLDEYINRWAIRHEFGHVLGFPDCYVEYYEQATGRMVNYQLDVTNLMCSRRGHLQPQHVEALRKAYAR